MADTAAFVCACPFCAGALRLLEAAGDYPGDDGKPEIRLAWACPACRGTVIARKPARKPVFAERPAKAKVDVTVTIPQNCEQCGQAIGPNDPSASLPAAGSIPAMRWHLRCAPTKLYPMKGQPLWPYKARACERCGTPIGRDDPNYFSPEDRHARCADRSD